MERIYVSADIEGTCGIADWKETEAGDFQSEYFRRQMTQEVAAACEGAISAGIGDILVKDAHSSGRNIDPSALPENTRILRSWTRDPYMMMAGLEPGFAGVFFTGYHSPAGSDGNPLAHTMNGANVWIRINGMPASEFLINSYTAASIGVPVLLLTGDEALCSSAHALGWEIRTVAVSKGIGGASVSIHPRTAQKMIREAAIDAIQHRFAIPPQNLPDRFEIEIRFREHNLALRGSFFPGAQRRGTHELAFVSNRWSDVLVFLFFVL